MPQIKQLSRIVGDLKKVNPMNWFPGHMYGGMKAMIGKLATVDCVIEVHDARIPLTGRNKEFRDHLGAIKPHLLVLNKRDLADLSNWNVLKTKLREQGDRNVILTDLTGTISSHNCRGYDRILSTAVELINKSDRFNRQTADHFKVMIVGIPNVGKSTLINRLRQHHIGLKGGVAITGKLAGVTRSVENRIKICSRPPIYSLDTPGILEPGIVKDRDKAYRLAVCANIRDDVLDPLDVASYLLKFLNKSGQTSYMGALGLLEPPESMNELYLASQSEEAKSIAILPIEGKILDLNTFCWHFIKQFRMGHYGAVMFDEI